MVSVRFISNEASLEWFYKSVLCLNPGVPGSALGGTAIPGSTASSDRSKPGLDGGNAVHF